MHGAASRPCCALGSSYTPDQDWLVASRVSGREKSRRVPECLGRNRAAPSAHFPLGGSVLPAAKMGVGTMWPLCGTVVDLVGKSWRKSGPHWAATQRKACRFRFSKCRGTLVTFVEEPLWISIPFSPFSENLIAGRNIRNHTGGARAIGSLLLRQYERVSNIGRAIVLAVFADE